MEQSKGDGRTEGGADGADGLEGADHGGREDAVHPERRRARGAG